MILPKNSNKTLYFQRLICFKCSPLRFVSLLTRQTTKEIFGPAVSELEEEKGAKGLAMVKLQGLFGINRQDRLYSLTSRTE